eukprot:scaffold66582_cov38-Cyclotella_meneghiniana.AAC.5
MLHRLLEYLQGNFVENRILAISELATLEFKATDTGATYMARIRGIPAALQGVAIDQFLTLLTLSRLDKDLYPGVVSLFRQGNTALLSDTLPGIETRLEKEDSLRSLQGESTDSARRAKAPKPLSNPPKPDTSNIIYPPTTKQLQFKMIKSSQETQLHVLDGYCFPFLTAGFLLQYDPEEAEKKISELQQKSKDKPRGPRVTDKEDNDKPKNTSAPAPAFPPPKEVVGSGKQATSAEHKKPPSYSEAAKQPPPQKHNYYDAMESDSDNGLGLLVRKDNDNTKSASSSYRTDASARPTTVSSTFSSIMRGIINTLQLVNKSQDETLCCADSGATRHMFPDYKTFVSYHL